MSYVKKGIKQISVSLIFVFSCIFLICSIAISSKKFTNSKVIDFPFIRFVRAVKELVNIQNRFVDTYSSKPVTLQGDKADTVVLFIGESARGDHWSLNGYNRNTNAYTSGIKNFLSFKNAISCNMSTGYSVPCLLTGNESDKFYDDSKQSSLISYFYNSGYDIYVVLTGANDVLNSLSSEMKLVKKNFLHNEFWNRGQDLLIIKFMQEIVNIKDGRKKFIIINGIGSHHNYENIAKTEYYDKIIKDSPLLKNYNINYQKHSAPYCNYFGTKTYKYLVDWYDATVLQTDYIIKNVITQLQDKNALFLYTSDHGESFGEKGQPCLHCYNSKEIWNVPFAIWASNLYISKNKALAQNIVNNYNKINKGLLPNATHANVFSTLLDCSGIESQAVKKELSFCNKNIAPSLLLKKCNRFKDPSSNACFYKDYEKYQ